MGIALLLVCLAVAVVRDVRQMRQIARLKQDDDAMTYRNDYDELTGLYSKRHFYEAARRALDDNPDTAYAILRWDLSRFKVFNDLYGMDAGDKLLKDIGAAQRRRFPPDVLAARVEGDHFVYCLPLQKLDVERVSRQLQDWFKSYSSGFEFVTNIGVYVVRDRKASVSLMCDWALLALRSVKDNYHQHYAFYDDGMRDRLILEQQTVADMRVAIEENQFVLHFQPQINYDTGELFGAEALVRWAHPTRGLLLPGDFIPAFEKSGFITELDRYVWRMACGYIRKWMDAGNHYVPITVSVNVSRIDIYNPRLIDDVLAIVEEYGVPADMLKLEITESAYVENPRQLIDMVNAFKARGFTVEMDDFGSGYSSLNTLKDVPVDVLKLDLKFLAGDEHTGRGGNILSSVIRMARWLDMPVIAEGVETMEQARYLKSIGCVMMQGYYFARPMPAEAFEEYVRKSRLGAIINPENDAFQDFDELWDPRSPSAKLFTDFIGGAAILEYADGNLEALRINDKCFRIFGFTRESYTKNGLKMLERIHPADVSAFMESLRRATDTREEAACELRTRDVGDRGVSWLRTRLQLIAKADRSSLYFVSIEDISEQKRLSLQLEQTNGQLSLIMESMPGGFFRFAADGTETLGFVSPSLLRMLGFTEAELRERCHNRFSLMLAEEDRERTLSQIAAHRTAGEEAQCEFRILARSGDARWFYGVSRVETSAEGQAAHNMLVTDIDREKRIREAMLRERERYRIIVEESGTALFEWNGQEFYHSATYDQLYASVLPTEQVFGKVTPVAKLVHPQDAEAFSGVIAALRKGENTVRCTLRVRMTDRTYKWAHISLTALRGESGARDYIIGAINIIDEIMRIEQTQRWQEERYRILMEDLNVATFDYDPASNVMTRLVNIANKGVKEKIISDYMTRAYHSSIVHPDSVPTLLSALQLACRNPMSACIEYKARYGGGNYRWVRARYVSLSDENGNVYRVVGKIDDIQEIKEIEQSATELKHIAEVDGVTALLTRAAFERAVTDYLAGERGDAGALIMLDIDNFKKINDTFGHIEGDKVLHAAADKTRESFRREDILGRIGGDEFMVMMTRCSGREMLEQRLDMLLNSLRKAELPDGRAVTGSIGATVVRAEDRDFQALYQQADDALYQAKKAGKDRYAVKN